MEQIRRDYSDLELMEGFEREHKKILSLDHNRRRDISAMIKDCKEMLDESYIKQEGRNRVYKEVHLNLQAILGIIREMKAEIWKWPVYNRSSDIGRDVCYQSKLKKVKEIMYAEEDVRALIGIFNTPRRMKKSYNGRSR